MKRDLDKLIEFVGRHFVFDEQIYPELKGANEEKRLAFAVRHSALHFSKTAGKVAAVSEDVDHGGELDIETVKENIPKAIISTLKLSVDPGHCFWTAHVVFLHFSPLEGACNTN